AGIALALPSRGPPESEIRPLREGGSMSSRCERGLLGALGTVSAALLLLCPAGARAEAAGAIDKGDTAWVLVCSALVLLMRARGPTLHTRQPSRTRPSCSSR